MSFGPAVTDVSFSRASPYGPNGVSRHGVHFAGTRVINATREGNGSGQKHASGGQLFGDYAIEQHRLDVPRSSGMIQLNVKYAGAASQPSDNLYLTGLPSPCVTQATLEKLFTDRGHKVMRSKVLPDIKGIGDSAGMVQLSSKDSAAAAMQALNSQIFSAEELLEGVREVPAATAVAPPTPARSASAGIALQVKFAGYEEKPSANLYISGLPSPQVTEETLRRLLADLIVTMRRCKILPDDGRGHSCAMVEVESTEEALMAIGMLNGQVFPSSAIPADGRINDTLTQSCTSTGDGLVVRYAGKAQEPSAHLYIVGLPSPETDEATLAALFRSMNLHVMKSKVLLDTQRSGSCAAMVQLESTEEAAVAIEALNGVPLSVKELAKLVAQAPAVSSSSVIMEVRYAGREEKPSAHVFMTGLPNFVTEDSIAEALFHLGFTVKRAHLLPDAHRRGLCACLVQLGSLEEAASLIIALHDKVSDELF